MLYRGKERALIARLVLGLVKAVHRGKLGENGSMAREIEALLISGAVMLGEVDGRPRTASGIARIVGTPRATVTRKLEELIERGVVLRRGNRYYMNDENIAKNDAYIDEAMRLIRNSVSTHESVQNGRLKVD